MGLKKHSPIKGGERRFSLGSKERGGSMPSVEKSRGPGSEIEKAWGKARVREARETPCPTASLASVAGS